MAFYIIIRKINEDNRFASYQFAGDGERYGEFSINKKSGDILLTKKMPGDEAGHFFNRAAMKVLRAWRQGELPELAEWAS